MTEELDQKLYAAAQLVANCVPKLGEKGFGEALMTSLGGVVPIEDATLLYYAKGDLPRLLYQAAPHARRADTMERFLAGAFLLDPYYRTANEHNRFGLFTLKELAPEDFHESEYFISWYANCGFTDECGYVLRVGQDAFVNVALGRVGKGRFTATQVKHLRSLLPAVETLCQQHWSNESARDGEESDGLRRQLHLALDNFGSSLLTDRETQVINLVLHGHSTKSVAERLGISVETVKLHRKHAYAKLEVSSQAELFYLFLDSVMSARDYRGGDTLISYLQKPAR
ncbi:MAG: LuxR C-terminal-related transcriptional regulator [Congregibacter sp.]